MKIERGVVVCFHYRLTGEDGRLIEDSNGGEPAVYMHGYGGIVPGLENAMAGRESGEHFEVALSVDEGYGARREDAQQRIQKKAVLTRGKLRPGQVISVSTDHGPRQVTVVKAGRFVVDVDLNHPLAGKALNFSVDITDLREATAEERAHGHAHGADGHAHHH